MTFSPFIMEPVKSGLKRLKLVPWRGVLAVVGGFLIQLTLGSYNSFANIMPYMVSYMRKYSEDDVEQLKYTNFIIVQSAWGVTQGCVLPIGSLLVRIIGVRVSVALGSVLFVTAPMITSWTIQKQLWNVVLSYGVIASVGQNLAIIPTLTIPMAWFPHRRGLVSGVVVSGFGMGALLFNQFQTRMVNPRNLPVSRNGTDAGYFVDDEILLQVPSLLIYSGALYAVLLGIGACLLLSLRPPPPAASPPITSKAVEAKANTPLWSIHTRDPVVMLAFHHKSELAPAYSLHADSRSSLSSSWHTIQKAWIRSNLRASLSPLERILSRREFYLLWVTRFGLVMISQGFFGLYKAFGLKELGYNDDFLSGVGALAAVFNCMGRFGFGYLLDRIPYKTLMLFESMLVLVLSSTFYTVANLSQYGMAASLWLLNLFVAGVFSMHPAVCNKIFGPNLDSMAIGLVGSSDIVNNLLIGFLSRPLMASLGWAGYFLCISSLTIIVIVATLVFPKSSPKYSTDEEKDAHSNATMSEDLSVQSKNLSEVTKL